MLIHNCELRVLYADTDQMGYVHHSKYAVYYEKARWELLRSIGISYKIVEESNIMLPVVELTSKFIKPAFYDELLRIHTELIFIKGALIKFIYYIYNEKDELINEAETVLAFINKNNRKPCRPSSMLIEAIKEKGFRIS
jgi:acyl-CoA thioester hydrolase